MFLHRAPTMLSTPIFLRIDLARTYCAEMALTTKAELWPRQYLQGMSRFSSPSDQQHIEFPEAAATVRTIPCTLLQRRTHISHYVGTASCVRTAAGRVAGKRGAISCDLPIAQQLLCLHVERLALQSLPVHRNETFGVKGVPCLHQRLDPVLNILITAFPIGRSA